jgi:hypothetical protein
MREFALHRFKKVDLEQFNAAFRIWIQQCKNDSQKIKKMKQFYVLNCWMFSLEDPMLLLVLESPSWEPENKCNATFINMKFLAVNIRHQKPGSGSIFGKFV